MTLCYNYNNQTKEYVSCENASPSPLEPGVYLLPDFATFTAPPEEKQGYARCWNGLTWDYSPDYRNKTYWDKETKTMHSITELGKIPLSTWTEKEPLDSSCEWNGEDWIIPLDVLKSRKIAEIRQQSDSMLKGIQKNFSEPEFLSWNKQECGARAIMNDADDMSEDAVFVRTMAQARGISVDQLVEKIMACVTPYTCAMAQLLGEQQRKEDLVLAAKSSEELEKVSSGFTQLTE